MGGLLSRLDRGSGPALSGLRVAMGVMLAWHGYRKFADGLEGFEGFLDFLGLPAVGFLAFVVATLELVGGILLAVGLATRPVALLFTIHFALIFFWVKLVKLEPVFLVGGEQPGVELDLIYLVSSIYFVIAGPGPIALDRILGLERSEADRAREVASAVA